MSAMLRFYKGAITISDYLNTDYYIIKGLLNEMIRDRIIREIKDKRKDDDNSPIIVVHSYSELLTKKEGGEL